MLLCLSASYAGRIAPPGYPKTCFTPSRSMHSHKIPAPVIVLPVVLSAIRLLTPVVPKRQNPPSQHFWRAGFRELAVSFSLALWFPPHRGGYKRYPSQHGTDSLGVQSAHIYLKRCCDG